MILLTDKQKSILEWVYCILIAIVIAILIRYFVGTPTVVKQNSMVPTLLQDQRLWLNRWSRTIHQTPKRGEIITFEAPSTSYVSANEANLQNAVAKYENEPKGLWNKFTYYVLEINKVSFIKRVIALPGEHVKIENGKVYINGEELAEPYLQPGVTTNANYETTYSNYNYFSEFTVPEGYIFAMGDNRSQSTDCRAFGCIPIEKVESKVWIRFWPLNLFGKV